MHHQPRYPFLILNIGVVICVLGCAVTVICYFAEIMTKTTMHTCPKNSFIFNNYCGIPTELIPQIETKIDKNKENKELKISLFVGFSMMSMGLIIVLIGSQLINRNARSI